MYLGNIMLLILNLPLINLWVRIILNTLCLSVPVDFALLSHRGFQPGFFHGSYLFHGIFGVVGYVMKKFEDEPPPDHGLYPGAFNGKVIAAIFDHFTGTFQLILK